MRKQLEVPNIVETYKFGKTIVHIADNCIRTDPAEVKAIWDEAYEIGFEIEREWHERGCPT